MARSRLLGAFVRIEMHGAMDLVRTLDQLKGAAVRRIMRPSVRAAMSPINKAAKRRAPTNTKLLRKSIGIGVMPTGRVRKKGRVVGYVGPRYKGFKVKRGRRMHTPAMIGHLVERDTKPHKIPKKRQGDRVLVLTGGRGTAKHVSGSTGKITRQVDHPGTTGTHFLEKAIRSSIAASRSVLIRQTRAYLHREARRAAARGKSILR
jgi:hypothetical protein